MDDFLKTVSSKLKELNDLIAENDETKSLIVIATEDYKNGRVGFIHNVAGISTTVIESVVEFMKTTQGNVIWQAVRKTEQNKTLKK